MARTNAHKRDLPTLAVEGKATRMAGRLRQYYQLGQAASSTDQSARDFAAAHGVGEHLMRKFKRFAREYTPRDLEALCDTVRPNGLPLQWGHVNYLLGIHDKQQRLAMQRKAIEHGWTAPQLNIEIRKKFGTENGHGRPMAKPATPVVGLQQLMAEAEMWIRRCDVVMIEVQQAKSPSRELRRQAERASDVLQKMKRAASLTSRRLAALLQTR